MLRRRSNQYITKEFLWTNQASGITAPSIGDSNGNRLVLDNESVWRGVKAEETRLYGLRRVENLLSYSEDNVSLTFPTQANAVITANTIELTGTGSSYAYLQYTPVAGRDYIFRAKIQAVSGANTNIGIRLAGGGAADVKNVFDLSDGEEKVISLPVTAVSTSTLFIGVDNRAAEISGVNTAATKIVFTELQLEDATGRSDTTTPSEYVPSGVGTGSELVTNGTFDTDTTGWSASASTISVVSNQLRVTNTGAGFGLAYISFPTLVGATYVASVDFSAGTASTGKFGIGTTASGEEVGSTSLNADTSKKLVFTATATTTYIDVVIANAGATTYADFDNISVKRIDHGANVDSVKYFPYLNPYTVASNVLTDTGSRVGIDADKTELVTNGGFDTDTSWAKGTGWSIAAGVATHTGASAGGITQTILTPGVYYEISFEVTLTGAINVYAGDTLQAVGTSGTHKLTLYCTGNGILQFYGASDYTLDNVSVKRVDTIKGLMMEGAATELSGRSADIGNWTNFSCSFSQTVAGLDGASTGFRVTDSSAVTDASCYAEKAVANDTAKHFMVCWVAYNASPSVYPKIHFTVYGGTTQVPQSIVFDPSDGSYSEVDGDGSVDSITRIGDFWRVQLSVQNNSTGNTILRNWLFPAWNTDGSATQDVTAQGYSDFASCEMYTGTPSYSPILTTGGTTKTRLADVEATISGTAWPDGDVSVEFDVTPFFDVALVSQFGILAPLASAVDFIFFHTTAKSIRLSDGTQSTTKGSSWTNPGDTIKVKVRANASTSTMNFSVAGVAATEAAYDGSFNPSGNITLFKSLTLGAAIKNLRIFSEDLGEGWLTS